MKNKIPYQTGAAIPQSVKATDKKPEVTTITQPAAQDAQALAS